MLKKCFSGKIRLIHAFLFCFIPAITVPWLVRLILLKLEILEKGATKTLLLIFSFEILIAILGAVVVWRNSWNVEKRIWGYIARGAILLSVTPILVIIGIAIVVLLGAAVDS